MKLEVAFEGNIIPDNYAKAAKETIEGMAIQSFPFAIMDIPEGTKSLAWTFLDYDAVPVCGFPYIHWLVANASPEDLAIEANYSMLNKNHLEGKNSLTSKFLPESVKVIDQQYIEPKPPDKDHDYLLTVYALDDHLDLKNGFYYNELLAQLEVHYLDHAQIKLVGKH
ncbi:YbhB/YbcL family Raf kinase inhibitor-like protein [Streptococcus iniae]